VRRLEEARRLLIETELSIAEVALRCGFADQAGLTHAVRRVLSTTPGRLRRHRSCLAPGQGGRMPMR
jgi:AraC-like DNA-binding protein